MIHIKDSQPMGRIWSLDSPGEKCFFEKKNCFHLQIPKSTLKSIASSEWQSPTCRAGVNFCSNLLALSVVVNSLKTKRLAEIFLHSWWWFLSFSKKSVLASFSVLQKNTVPVSLASTHLFWQIDTGVSHLAASGSHSWFSIVLSPTFYCKPATPNSPHSKQKKKLISEKKAIRVFPKIVVPPNHPF